MAGVGAGSLGAAPLLDGLGLRPAMAASGPVMALTPVLLWPRLRHVDTQLTVGEDRITLLRTLPLFAPLPRFSLEHLARRATSVALDPARRGAAGEPGELFYVVEAGELSVRVDGVERNRPSPGQGFREIALLHRVPRTATVVALTPARLLAVDADTFIAAVTSNLGAEAAALSLAEEHLRRGAPRPVDAG